MKHTLTFLALIALMFAVNACDDSSLKDSRDGKKYKTVKIGSQIWMAENLNYEMEGSYCYNDDPVNCEKFGRLYLWLYALRACPSGWHLPSKAEFETLFATVGEDFTLGQKLKSTSGWNDGTYVDGPEKAEFEKTSAALLGNAAMNKVKGMNQGGNGSDAFSFTALPAGDRFVRGGYGYMGHGAYFWSSTAYSKRRAYCMDLLDILDDAGLFGKEMEYGFSVRCVKN